MYIQVVTVTWSEYNTPHYFIGTGDKHMIAPVPVKQSLLFYNSTFYTKIKICIILLDVAYNNDIQTIIK